MSGGQAPEPVRSAAGRGAMNTKPYKCFRGYLPYLWLALGLSAGYLLLAPHVRLYGNSSQSYAAGTRYAGDVREKIVTLAVLGGILAVALLLRHMRRLDSRSALTLTVAAGMVLRIGYMLNTPFYVRGHDVESLSSSGHLGYIYTIYRTFRPPDTNSGQFYHPPLAHLLSAVVARGYAMLTHVSDLDTIFEAARLVPCFASCALLIVCWRLFDELRFDDGARQLAMTVVAFQPTFFLLSASINNDMLMVFFFMTALLYTVRWHHRPTFRNILPLALSIGCAMSTKFSGALVAVITAAVFVIHLARNIRTGQLFRLLGQYAVFAAVCVPLGLWYTVRNYLLFGQPPTYVLPVSMTSGLYIGGHSLVSRFLSFPSSDLLSGLYCMPYHNFQILLYTVRCSVFGEFSFTHIHDLFGAILLLSNALLILCSLAAMAYIVARGRRTDNFARFGLFALWLILIASFIAFNIRFPFACTMDFRYIVPTVIVGAAFLGLARSRLQKRNGPLPQTISTVLTTLTALFAIASAAFYLI